jgi:hypothetical protein
MATLAGAHDAIARTLNRLLPKIRVSGSGLRGDKGFAPTIRTRQLGVLS